MHLEIKNLSNNTLLEPDEIVIEELYTVKEKMDYSKVISNIKSIKYMIIDQCIDQSSIKGKYHENVILNSKNVFDIVYKTGQSLFKVIEDKDTIKRLFDGGFIFPEERNYFEDIYSKWIMDYGFPYQASYGFPYQINNEYCLEPYNFIKDCLRLYIFFYIRKLIANYEMISSQQVDYNPQLLNIIGKLNKLINLFKNNWFYEFEIYQKLYSNDNDPFPSYDNYQTFIERTKLQLNKINDNKQYLNYIKQCMVDYITDLMQKDDDYSKDFIFHKPKLIPFDETGEQKKYYCNITLMSIAYNKLLENLTASKFDYKVKACKNPNCSNTFDAVGNSQFCSEECAKAGKKMRDRKYNKTHNRTEQTKLWRKHTKILKELISLKDQYNFPKEIANKINYYIEKKSISFHDVGIEELYIEVKNYLKNKYNILID